MGNGTCLVERFCQVLGTLLVRDIPIGRVVGEEFLLTVQRSGQGFLRINVLLTPIHDTNEPELERVCSPGQDIIGVSSRIHEIELGEDSDSPTTLRVYGPGKFQRLRVRKVDICGGD